MTTATSHGQLISRGEFDRLLSALLAFDHALVEFYMQMYGTPPHQQLAMRRQNRNLHGLVRKRVPEFLFGKRRRLDGWKKLVQSRGKTRSADLADDSW